MTYFHIIIARFACAALITTAGASLTHADQFTLDSPSIDDSGRLRPEQLLNGNDCGGKNLSPALYWHGAPPETQSFAVTIYDPDAPTGSGWWYWIVFNIPRNIYLLHEGDGVFGSARLPAGSVQGRNDSGETWYGGPCEHAGGPPHRYVITAWALKSERLPIKAGISAAATGLLLNRDAIARVTLTAHVSNIR